MEAVNTIDQSEVLSPGRRRAVLATMCLALVIVVGSVAMLNIALREIAVDLGASQADQQWIVDAYVLVLAALLLPAGALGDRFGRRTALLVGIVIFVIASGAAAMMTDAGALIAWRGVAGIGAALIMPGTLATITSVFPAEERARAVGVWAGFAGGGAILGTIVAGVLLEFFWWGSIFLLVAVVAVIAFVATLLTTPNTKNPGEANLDPPGAVLSAVAIGGLVLGIIEGPARGWTDALTVAGLGVGIVAGVVFVLWELRARRPLLDPRLFTNRGFATSTTALAMLFLTMFGFFFVVLQFLQLQLGLSPLEASLAVLPLAVTMFPLSTISAVAGERYGMRVVATVGLVSTAVAFGYLATLNQDSSYLALVPGLLLSGAGIALAMGPATNQIVSSLPAAKQGVASAVNDTARELGVALGVAVLGSAFNAGYRSDIDTVASRLPARLAEPVKDSPATALAVSEQLGRVGSGIADAAHAAFAVGMRWSMLLGTGILVLTAVYVWWKAPGLSNEVEDPA